MKELIRSRARIEIETYRGRKSVKGEIVLTEGEILVVAREGFRKRVILAVPLWLVASVEKADRLREELRLTLMVPERITRKIWIEVDDVERWFTTLRALVRNLPL